MDVPWAASSGSTRKPARESEIYLPRAPEAVYRRPRAERKPYGEPAQASDPAADPGRAGARGGLERLVAGDTAEGARPASGGTDYREKALLYVRMILDAAGSEEEAAKLLAGMLGEPAHYRKE